VVVFDVSVNGEKRCRAGAGPSGLISSVLHWVGAKEARGKQSARREAIHLRVGGIVDPDEHVTWLSETLRKGDRITIEILEAENGDEPRRREKPPRPDPSNPPRLKLAKSRKR